MEIDFCRKKLLGYSNHLNNINHMLSIILSIHFNFWNREIKNFVNFILLRN